jgi:RNA polymerase sigma factor (sigma-70 family)
VTEFVFLLFRADFRALDADNQRALFLAFREFVYRDIYFMLNDHALTEDVIQESFLKAIKHGPKTREGSNMNAWVRRVSRNTCYDLLRKNKKYRHLLRLDSVNDNDEAAPAAAEAQRTEDTVETSARNEALFAAIAELKVEYRQVLLLFYISEMSYQEIQEEFGITDQVLTQRLARARKKLAVHFLQKWGETR